MDNNTPESQAGEQAAFEASFNDEQPTAAVATETAGAAPVEPVSTDKPEAAPTAPSPVTLTAEELMELRAAASKVHEFQGELRKAHGRIGALNDQLQNTMKAKDEAGKPATLTSLELKRMKEQFPEFATELQADLAEIVSTMRGDPDAVKKAVDEQVSRMRQEQQQEAIAQRQELLEERHPDAREVVNSAPFAAWISSLPADEQAAIQNTNSPVQLSKKLTAFKEWSKRAVDAQQKSKARLESAMTPKGAGRTSQQTLSEREEMEKGFALGFDD